ncbi:MAG: EAL domain-containing protein [Magnetospirillum sp.]|nr:EAL domain-containing protein [Magnetospirillum sp.]
MITRFRDLHITTKLLFTILPVVAASVVAFYLMAEQVMRRQRLDEISNRVHAYAATQAGIVSRQIWEFDEKGVERQVANSTPIAEVGLFEVRETSGRVLASRRQDWPHGEVATEHVRIPLTYRANERDYAVGELIIDYHDGPLRRDLGEQRSMGAIVLALALALLGGATVVATRVFVERPLARLRDSLEANSAGKGREPLVWSGHDELGEVVDAYNGLLAEVEERTGELTVVNRTLREEQAKLLLAASVYDNTIEGIVVTDAAGRIVSVNAAFSEITGYGAEEVAGRSYHFLRDDGNSPAFYHAIGRSLARHRHWEGEGWARRKDGTPFLAWATISVIPDGEGSSGRRFLGVFNDITELRRKDEHIHHLAYHDPLTGLPNRRLLQDRLDHAIALAARSSHSIALIFIDVDQFKTINDSLGHDVGDRLLEVVAKCLGDSVRAMDTVCRWGGDEFVVMVEHCTSAQQVRQIAEKILNSVHGPINLEAATVHVSVSLGIAMHPQDGRTASELMRNADAALFEAKVAGRNRFHFFDETMNQRVRLRLETENDLRVAIDRDQLELYYQPKFSISMGQLCGLEALLRWRHPEKGLIPPSDFIPLAEETGLVIPIGEWVVRETCQQIRRWGAAGLRQVQVAVNLSARHVSDPVLVDTVCQIVEDEGIDPTLIEIEVTETAVMKDPEQAIKLLGQLRAKGFGIAVDDFGTGYSSLSYLGKLPITTLKIDRSFVKEVEVNPEDAEIVRTIVAMANALDLKLVAEGVETETQKAFLEKSSCDVIQGYLIARPLPPAMVEAWLAPTPAERLCV